jgi:NAD(P)-dependent dehydrogenase (short-subunit alcohol dehydrogenase family)
MTTFLVTGAAGGIGGELCRQIQTAGAKAIAVCRKSAVDLDRLGVQVEAGIDITADDSVADLARRLQVPMVIGCPKSRFQWLASH